MQKCRVSWFIVTVWIWKVAVFLCKVYTFLWMLIFQGQTSLVDLLVAKGAIVNATDYHGSTPLHLACQKGYQNVTVSTTPNLNNKYMPLTKLFYCYCHLDLLGNFYQNCVKLSEWRIFHHCSLQDSLFFLLLQGFQPLEITSWQLCIPNNSSTLLTQMSNT